MPETRSKIIVKNGSAKRPPPSHTADANNGTTSAPDATAATSSATATATSSDDTTERTTTEMTTSTDTEATTSAATENTEKTPPAGNINPTVQPHPADDDRRSTKSKKSKRALRLAKAKEELIRLQIELAAARVAVIEAESSDTDQDDNTVIEDETRTRVDTWIDNAQAQMLAITSEPHNKGTATREENHITENPHISENSKKRVDYTEQQTPFVAALPPPPTVYQNREPGTAAAPPVNDTPRAPHPSSSHTYDQQQRPMTSQAGATATTIQSQQTGLTELATAIARAARSPRYLTELPTYTGAHQEWLSFKAAYTEMSSSFTEIENVARLRRSLRGRAKEAVENLLIHSAKPEEIMKTLESRFGRPDSIAATELERLKALPRLTDNPRDLCIFSSRVSNIAATLRALHRTYYLQNPDVTRAMIDKLTPAMKYRWFDYAAQNKQDEAELLKLTRFLEREAEQCSPYAPPETIPLQTDSTSHNFRRNQKTFSTTEQTKIAHPCPVCTKMGHNTVECERFKEADVDARWDIAKARRLCFRCLKYKNRTHSCRGTRCHTDGCQQWHNRILHFTRKPTETDTKTEVVSSTWTNIEARSYLKIVPVRASGPRGDVDTYALLDDGSTVTLINAELADQIGAKGRREPLRIEAIAQTKVKAAASRRVALTLHGAQTSQDIYARTIEDLHLSPQEITDADLSNCTHLDDIRERLKYEKAKPQILIGQDNWHLLIATEVRKGKRHQPIASLTTLGWVIHGAHTRTTGQRVHYVNHTSTIEENMDEQLRRYFALESLTIEPQRPHNDPEKLALDLLQKYTQQTEDGHYETALLWKEEKAQLPINYENALKRLISTERKIDKDSTLRAKYDEQMNALITKGYAELAPAETTAGRTWYLPHFPVINPMKPGKIRVVHDAAAITKGVSLNDRLLTGPDLIQSLPGVLMRLRQYPIAVSADIAEMFMQVKIRAEDRDALRYLWRGSQRDQKPQEYRMTSLIFGATSSPATAIYVKNVNAEKYKDTEPEAYRAILKNHYVDDYIQSFETTEKAIDISTKVREIHRRAHFELKQWASNSKEVLDALGADKQTNNNIDLNDSTNQGERVLGLIWRPETDVLAFNLDLNRLPPEILKNENPTKREALKIIMSLFDPLGLAAPITTRAKQILQEMWRRGIGWDERLDAELALQWCDWMKHLLQLQHLKIPRCYPNYSEAASRQLHIFVDASEVAYSAAVYWRMERPNGEVSTTLVLAKARVAPLKIISIPRLELQAAVMGSRMATAVIEEHDIKPDSKTFWTDSKTVLTWLRTGARSYKPFVAHRIAAIEENSSLKEWRWVPTKLNVADDATRDVPHHLDVNHRWYAGPEFLRQDPSTWPTEPQIIKEKTGEERTLLTTEKKKSVEKLEECIPKVERFSRWERLLRATARVLLFIRLTRRKKESVHYRRMKKNMEKDPTWKLNKKHDQQKTKPQHHFQQKRVINAVPLDTDTLQAAEELLIRTSQQQSFGREIENLKNNKTISPQSRLYSLSTELVNGVLRLKTRIGRTENITDRTKSPPILDGDHRITKMFIHYVHRQLHHAGTETTINECRQHYWVLRLRTTTKMIIHRCLPCRLKKATPPQPPTGNHPYNRLAHHRRPFTYTGLDYFGPYNVKIGRTTHKRYVALFTCLTTRAVHLEPAASLDKNSAIMAIRRMTARRGCPVEIWSDNGTNLHGADRELRRSIDESTAEECLKKKIKWCFIPPSAPFMGGAWERLVRSVKIALNVALQNHVPTEEMFNTVLSEAEYTVNSRPLTHVSLDPEDPESLTPNHFLLGGSGRVMVTGTFDDSDLVTRAHWRATQRIADMFWARWLKEYLPEMQHRREPHARGTAIKVGDVVLIADSTLPRNTWPRGIVTATYPGTDGVVRAVDVYTKGGTLRRPTKKLIVLMTEPADPPPTEDTSQPQEQRTAGEMFGTAAENAKE